VDLATSAAAADLIGQVYNQKKKPHGGDPAKGKRTDLSQKSEKSGGCQNDNLEKTCDAVADELAGGCSPTRTTP